MRLIGFVPWAVLSALCVAACGGNDSSNGSSGGITLEELPKKYAGAFCQLFSNCAGELFTIYRPGESCLDTYTTTFEEALATLPNAVDAGRLKYHADKVQKCLDDVAAGTCEFLSARAPASCKAALEGTVKTGEACTLDAECAGDQYCKVGASCPGACAPYEQAGGNCTSNDNCDSGLKCGDNHHCVKPSAKGEACEEGEPDCADGLLCLGQDDDAKTPGTCYPIADALSGKVGDPCGLDGELCQAGYACEITVFKPVSGECVKKVAAGSACKVAFPDECPDDQYCLLDDNPLSGGTCTDRPKAGKECGTTIGGDGVCAAYARCDDGGCREIAHAGESCHDNDTCYSDHCVDGACVTANSCD